MIELPPAMITLPLAMITRITANDYADNGGDYTDLIVTQLSGIGDVGYKSGVMLSGGFRSETSCINTRSFASQSLGSG
jgi:hypothetical protein